MRSALALKVDFYILLNWRTAVLPELRKVVTFDEDIYFEGGRASNPPLRMIGVAACLLYTSPSPRDISGSRMPSSA